MPKLTVSVGYTLSVKPGSYEFARFDVGVAEIETDGNVQEQLEQAFKGYRTMWPQLEKELYQQILESGLLKDIRDDSKRGTPG